MNPNMMSAQPDIQPGSPVGNSPAYPEPNPIGTPIQPEQQPISPLSQEEMKANMQAAMGQLDSKYGDFNSKKFALGNKDQENKGALLREIFAYFESVGVDPSNPEEVNKYLEDLKIENPELFQQLEFVLESILGGSPGGTPSNQVPENMNINKYENLQQNL